jgi:protein-S-isoprenylcysteine O-methyltransferase Ste14
MDESVTTSQAMPRATRWRQITNPQGPASYTTCSRCPRLIILRSVLSSDARSPPMLPTCRTSPSRPGVRSGDVNALLVHVQTDVHSDRFVHGPSPCKFSTIRPTTGPVHWCSSARPWRATYVVAGVGAPEFTKPSCLGPIVVMRALELRIPPPLVALLVAAAMWCLSLVTTSLEAIPLARIALGVGFAVVGAAFSASGVVAFRRAKTTVNPMKPEAASSLVSAGVYRVTRNPMYLGLFFMLFAWAAFLWSAWSLLGPLVFAAYIGRFQIAPEERALTALFGSEYSAYKARVRRWL